MSSDDQVVKALKDAHEKIKSEIPFELLEKCYEVQKRFMFEKNSKIPQQEINKLVKDYVDNKPAEDVAK